MKQNPADDMQGHPGGDLNTENRRIGQCLPVTCSGIHPESAPRRASDRPTSHPNPASNCQNNICDPDPTIPAAPDPEWSCAGSGSGLALKSRSGGRLASAGMPEKQGRM